MKKDINAILNIAQSAKRGGRTPMEIAQALINSGADEQKIYDIINTMAVRITAKLRARKMVAEHFASIEEEEVIEEAIKEVIEEVIEEVKGDSKHKKQLYAGRLSDGSLIEVKASFDKIESAYRAVRRCYKSGVYLTPWLLVYQVHGNQYFYYYGEGE